MTNLVNLAKSRGYGGYVFDLENLSPAALAQYPASVAQARAALKPLGREVWVTAPFAEPGLEPEDASQAASDTMVLMAYDEHWGGDAGQGGGQPGRRPVRTGTRRTSSMTRPSSTRRKMVVALGDYGYDWTLGQERQGDQAARREIFYDATQDAKDSEASVSFDDDALNPTFGYLDDDGSKHIVWFLDAATVFNQIKVGDDYRPRGYALWRMGAEDPADLGLLPPAVRLGQARGAGNRRARHRRRLRRQGRGAARRRNARRRARATSRSTPTPA